MIEIERPEQIGLIATPCSPSLPPVMELASFAAAASSEVTAKVSISRVRPLVRRMIAPDTRPTTAAATAPTSRPDNGSPVTCTE